MCPLLFLVWLCFLCPTAKAFLPLSLSPPPPCSCCTSSQGWRLGTFKYDDNDWDDEAIYERPKRRRIRPPPSYSFDNDWDEPEVPVPTEMAVPRPGRRSTRRPYVYQEELEEDYNDEYDKARPGRRQRESRFKDVLENQSVDVDLDRYSSAPLQQRPLLRRKRPSSATLYYDADDDDEEEEAYEGTDYVDEYDEFSDNDEYDTDDETNSVPGNFWSNPVGQYDETAAPPTTQRRRRRITTAPISQPRPPRPATAFYQRFFWYGLDGDDTDGNTSDGSDKTLFGGTKGKFNGFFYLDRDGDDSVNSEGSTRQRRRSGATVDDWWSNNGSGTTTTRRQRRNEETPPFDPTSLQNRNQRATDKDAFGYEDDVDNEEEWYDDDGYNGDIDEQPYRPQSRRRRRRQETSTSSVWKAPKNILNTFMGDRLVDMTERAELYRVQMGLPTTTTSNRRPRRRPRRPPSTIYFEDDEYDDYGDDDYDGEEMFSWYNTDERILEDSDDDSDVEPLIVDAEVESTSNSTINETTSIKKLTWEERALAMERVPPATVPAWGPKGSLGIDARTKAVQDAMEDIELANQAVQKKEEKVEKLKDDVAVLRVDAELQKSQIQRRTDMTRMQIKERVRRMDFSVDEMARKLRYQESLLKLAREELGEMEARHWAVLSHNDPDDDSDGSLDKEGTLKEETDTKPDFPVSSNTDNESEGASNNNRKVD